jgi:hypothetical protein
MIQAREEGGRPPVPPWKRKLTQFLAVGTVALFAGVVIGWQLDRLFGPPPPPRGGVPRLLPVPFPSAGLDGETPAETAKAQPTQRLTAQANRPTGPDPKAVSQ